MSTYCSDRRRLARIRIPFTALRAFLVGEMQVMGVGLPKDLEIVKVKESGYFDDQIELVVWSSTFPMVGGDGFVPPYLFVLNGYQPYPYSQVKVLG